MADSVENPVIPEAVAKAISDVMNGVEKLAKDNKNQHGGYNFTSVDDFLEMTGKLCAEHGLIVIQDETEAELISGQNAQGKPKTSLKATYEFTLAHSSGVAWGPIKRHVLLDASGAQAFGAAQSYTLKHFMRSLFQIPTGDKDADEAKQSGFVVSHGEVKKDQQAEAARIKKELDKAGSAEAVKDVLGQNGVALKEIKEASESAYDYLMRHANMLSTPTEDTTTN